jgi:hypothetical protein
VKGVRSVDFHATIQRSAGEGGVAGLTAGDAVHFVGVEEKTAVQALSGAIREEIFSGTMILRVFRREHWQFCSIQTIVGAPHALGPPGPAWGIHLKESFVFAPRHLFSRHASLTQFLSRLWKKPVAPGCGDWRSTKTSAFGGVARVDWLSPASAGKGHGWLFPRTLRSWALLALVLVPTARNAFAAGFAASETVLPATTLGWVSISDPAGFREQFRATSYSDLLNDPALEPFVKSFEKQIREGGPDRLGKLGLTLTDLEGIPGGEITLAMVESSPGSAATLVLVDTTDHAEETQDLVDRIQKRLAERGATQLPADDDAADVVVYTLPLDEKDPKQTRRAVAMAHLPNALVVGDHAGVVAATVASLAGGREDCLASKTAFQAVVKHCSVEVPNEARPLRWYIEPLPYAFAARETYPPREKRSGPDHIDILANQGFGAVQAVGGYVHFDAGRFEMRHHTLVYAPPLEGREVDDPNKYDLAARMLKFPNAESVDPPQWVPSNASSWVTLHWDMQNAFMVGDTLVDEFVGEKGVFDDVIASLKEDPDGPQIDVENDLIRALGEKVVVVTHTNVPVDVDSERLLIAIEANDPGLVEMTITKSMSADPDMKEMEFDGKTIWELIDRSADIPKLEIETPGGAVPHIDRDRDSRDRRGPRGSRQLREPEERLLPHSAVTVAEGYLMIASHRDFLEHVLAAVHDGQGLLQSDDYRRVTDEMQQIAPDPLACRSFGRLEETLRTAYESIREGSMPKSKSLVGQAINLILDDGDNQTVREQKIDGSTLPEFDVIRNHFGTVGESMKSVDEGWYVTGFTLPRMSGEPEVARNLDEQVEQR